MRSRRQILTGTLGLAAAAALPARARSLGLPIGIQLYTVADELDKDFAGTMRQLAAAGYEDVELAGFHDHSAAALRDMFKAAHLQCRSAHFGIEELDQGLSKVLDDAHTLGLKYIVCAMPRFSDFAAITVDEWKWNADFCNRVGARVAAAGLTFAYHNHNLEFRKVDATTGFDLLIKHSDPRVVKFQLDCGWVATSGLDPADTITRYADRVRLLHLKDLKRGFKRNTDMQIETTTIGAGVMDWGALFAAAKKAGIEGYYVEIEAPFARPVLEMAAASAAYLKAQNI